VFAFSTVQHSERDCGAPPASWGRVGAVPLHTEVAGAEEFLVGAELLPLTATVGTNRICARDLGKDFFPWFVIVSAKYSPCLAKVYGGIELWARPAIASPFVGYQRR
jgi:hypothetical protein